jgi:hypothetical protein
MPPTPQPVPAPPTKEAAPPACPRCKGKLTDPGGLGWCQTCGYCHSLEQEKARTPLAAAAAPARRPSFLGGLEMFEVVSALPGWFWGLLLGIAAVAGATFVPATQLPRVGLLRTVWCTGQIGVGLLLIFAAQVWTLLLLAPEDEKLGNKDALLPTRLWAQALRRLPRTWRPVCLASWGLAAALSAVFIVGGLSHWLNYLPKASGGKTALTTR